MSLRLMAATDARAIGARLRSAEMRCVRPLIPAFASVRPAAQFTTKTTGSAGLSASSLTMSAPLNKSARSGLGVAKLWLTDRATFPVVLIATLASCMGTGVAARYMFGNPDVYVNKEERFTTLHHKDDRGSSWRQFRFRMANLKRNPINQSRQFDDLFAKDINQGVKR